MSSMSELDATIRGTDKVNAVAETPNDVDKKRRSQEKASDTARALNDIAADLRARAAALEAFVAQIERSCSEDETFVDTAFDQRVVSLVSSALMNNNNMGRMESAILRASSAVKGW